MNLEWPIFAAASLVVIYFSRGSLLRVRSHGFYRFLAWEALLVLIVWNLDVWFANPFVGYQIASWVCLALSIYFAIDGFVQLNRHGNISKERPGEDLVGWEKTTKLVESGLYRFIRHPLYGSLFLLAWGAFLKDPVYWAILPLALAMGFLVATVRVEERENVAYFGNEYEKYMERTKMLIPWIM